MNTDTEPVGLRLSATDAERCDRIRAIDAQIAALGPTDPAIYELVAERRELSQDLIWSKRNRGKK